VGADNENSAGVITKIGRDNENSRYGFKSIPGSDVMTKIGRGRPAKGERPMTAYERLKAHRLRKRAAS
jgi:hypothetical protein